jgi:hypothetical protein
MRPPDPTLDDAIERFWRECRALFAGRRVLTVEKAGGVTIDARVDRSPLRTDDIARLMQEAPCKREAEAEAKRGRRR